LSIKERLGVDIIQLETHKIAGGKPLKVVKEMVDYKRKGKSLEFNSAAAFDLADELLGDQD